MSGVQMKEVTADEDGMRLDRWFKAHFPSLRHGQLEKMLRKGQIRVAGVRAKSNTRLEPGQEIRVPPMPVSGSAQTKSIRYSEHDAAEISKLTIFEDKHLLVLAKPFGLPVQGGSKTKRHIDGMVQSLEKNGERPRLVHRLDKDTGGVLILARTRKAAQLLGDAFKQHDVEKTYWALTAGVPMPREGTIDLPIGKFRPGAEADAPEKVLVSSRDGKKAITDYQVLDDADRVAFVAMRPVTGRTHQLRVHAAAIECPIIGDGKYGGPTAHIEGLSPKLHLFCRSMTITHPAAGQRMTFKAPLSGHMLETWKFFGFDHNAVCDWPEGLR